VGIVVVVVSVLRKGMRSQSKIKVSGMKRRHQQLPGTLVGTITISTSPAPLPTYVYLVSAR
jgi:hypothetical protein